MQRVVPWQCLPMWPFHDKWRIVRAVFVVCLYFPYLKYCISEEKSLNFAVCHPMYTFLRYLCFLTVVGTVSINQRCLDVLTILNRPWNINHRGCLAIWAPPWPPWLWLCCVRWLLSSFLLALWLRVFSSSCSQELLFLRGRYLLCSSWSSQRTCSSSLSREFRLSKLFTWDFLNLTVYLFWSFFFSFRTYQQSLWCAPHLQTLRNVICNACLASNRAKVF